jgi:L-amino acid N-acyltransferase YncA
MIKNVIFENIDHNDLKQANAYVKWHKDAAMTENAICQRPDSSQDEYTIEQFKKDFNYQEKEGEFYGFMMKVDEEYIGYGQIIINQGNAFTKNKKVAWPSIAVGDSANHSKGFGKLICHKIYELAKYHNCEVIEVGVFEFNTRMKQILVENGFEMIGKKEKLTFTQDRWWSAEHYLD